MSSITILTLAGTVALSLPALGLPRDAVETIEFRRDFDRFPHRMNQNGLLLSDSGLDSWVWTTPQYGVHWFDPGERFQATAIADSGTVLGHTRLDDDSPNQGATWSPSRGTVILSKPAGIRSIYATSISPNGTVIAGLAIPESADVSIPVAWINGQFTTLTGFDRAETRIALDDAIVGQFADTLDPRVIRWSIDGAAARVLFDPRLEGVRLSAVGVSELMVGSSGSGDHAVLLEGENIVEVEPLPEHESVVAVDVNRGDDVLMFGAVVGDWTELRPWIRRSDETAVRLPRRVGSSFPHQLGYALWDDVVVGAAFSEDRLTMETIIWTDLDSEPRELQELVGTSVDVGPFVDMNNIGQILIRSVAAGRAGYAILTPIPEPAMIGVVVMLGFGLRRVR